MAEGAEEGAGGGGGAPPAGFSLAFARPAKRQAVAVQELDAGPRREELTGFGAAGALTAGGAAGAARAAPKVIPLQADTYRCAGRGWRVAG